MNRHLGPPVTGSILAFLFGMVGAGPSIAQVPGDLSARVEAEARWFPQSPADPTQVRNQASIAINPEWELEWGDRRHLITIEWFGRLDSADPERSHTDLRIASWEYAADAWEIRLGIRRVFWGVTESQHLVDIINQTDLVENPDGEDKLGQLMANFAWIQGWGTLDLFLMTESRQRTFPGVEGRLRFQPAVAPNESFFVGGASTGRIDLAARWAHTLGDWDVGLSHFYGTSRDPRFGITVSEAGNVELLPVYDLIHQTGLDVQFTRGGWLGKLEAIRRSGQAETFSALTGGFEYTLVGVLGSVADIGLLAEYSRDSRGQDARSLFQNDLFVGSRLALNDVQSTALLVGGAIDLDTGSLFFSVEGDRRIADGWTIEIESRVFGNTEPTEPLFAFRRDDYLRIAAVRFF
ncbi:MAG: hypothetical protein ABFS14_01720 [Gemmatimonadota bacterium]